MDQGKEIGWWGGAGSEKWEMVVELVHTLFWDGALAEESIWQTVDLIPKKVGDYRGIGIV